MQMEKIVKEKSGTTVQRLYERAVDELVRIQTEGTRKRNSKCIVFGRAFDVPLLMWEFDHFLEYGIPHCAGRAIFPFDRKDIRTEFRKIAVTLARLPKIFTHRDYHSRNLMVHKRKIRVLDFQDALLGAHIYDLASLLRDSYTRLDESLVDSLLAYYRDRMKGCLGRGDSAQSFRRLFDLMSIQRNLKAVGRFAYIDKVKKNPRFLTYIPQTLGYVRLNLSRYPELSRIANTLGPYLEEVC